MRPPGSKRGKGKSVAQASEDATLSINDGALNDGALDEAIREQRRARVLDDIVYAAGMDELTEEQKNALLDIIAEDALAQQSNAEK